MISCALRPSNNTAKRVIVHAGLTDVLVVHKHGDNYKLDVETMLGMSRKELSALLIWYAEAWCVIEVLEKWQQHNGWSTVLRRDVCAIA